MIAHTTRLSLNIGTQISRSYLVSRQGDASIGHRINDDPKAAIRAVSKPLLVTPLVIEQILQGCQRRGRGQPVTSIDWIADEERTTSRRVKFLVQPDRISQTATSRTGYH
jgi:hypothetical protein